MIAESKLRALRERLEADHSVRFHNGSLVEYEDCERCEGTGQEKVFNGLDHDRRECRACGGEKVRLLVTRPTGGSSRYRLDTEIRRAYEMALHGPKPKQQPPAIDFGECPF